MKEKRVLILSEAFGAGHTKAAQALKEGIALQQPDWNVSVCELGSMLRPTMNQWLTATYLQTLRFSPKLWGIIYRKAQQRRLYPSFTYILHHFFYTRIVRLLKSYQPHLIICTHPFPSAVISSLKKSGLKIPLYTLITDYAAHGAWISEGVDCYFVASLQVKEQLLDMEISDKKIAVTGIPVSPRFWTHKDQQFIRQQLGLADMLTVLYMGGGMGMGLSHSFLESMSKFGHQLQILFVTGKNKKLYQSLQKDKRFAYQSNVRIYSFVDNIDELMDAADLLITKPGGVTCSEALTKKIPMVLINPIPGQEEDNFYYMIREQWGFPVTNKRELTVILENFIANPSYFLHNKKNISHYPLHAILAQIIKKGA